MNRKAIILTAIAATAALSACTPQQINRAMRLTAQRRAAPAATVIADPPTAVNVTADCSTINFRIVEPAGTTVQLSFGNEPPTGFTVGVPNAWFSEVDGVVSGTVRVDPGYTGAHGYTWNVDTWTANTPLTRVMSGDVAACPLS